MRLGFDARGALLGLLWLGSRLRLPVRLLHGFVLGRAFGTFARMGLGSHVLARQASLGRNITVGRRCSIVVEELVVEDDVTIGDGVTVRCRRLVLRRGSRLDPGVEVRGVATPESALELGECAWVYSHCVLNTDASIEIGSRSALGAWCRVFTHSAYLPVTHGYPVTFAPVVIGSDVWLPWHVFVLPGARIGAGATVGAYSLVAGAIPENALAVGVPAKVVKDASAYRRRRTPEELARLGGDVVAEVARRWSGSFRARDAFRAPRRVVDRTGAGDLLLRDGDESLRVRLLSGSEDLVTTRSEFAETLYVTLDRRIVPEGSAVWIDLVTLQSRNAASAGRIGREFVEILTQWGIRFDWIPSAEVESRLRF